MQTKIHKLLGVAVTLALVVSLFGFTIPVSAQAGDSTMAAQIIPTAAGNVILNGSDVFDVAVSNDGTIYAINSGPAVFANLAGSVLMSRNGGNTFTALAAMAGGAAQYLNAIAVAPDDSQTVIVTDGLSTFLTTNGGTTWTLLGAAVAAPLYIVDVEVSPAIPGSIFGRHYFRAIATDTAVAQGAVGIQTMGVATTAWAAMAPAGAVNGDYTTVKASPNYMGDRAIATIYNTGAATFFQIVSQPGATAQSIIATTALTAITSTDYEREGIAAGVTALATICTDIALPSDWDPSLPSGRVSYVSVGSTNLVIGAQAAADRGGIISPVQGNAYDDVYRIDAGVALALNATTSLPVNTIAYAGTINDGNLFCGERLQPNVRYTINPQSAAPTWKSTQKAPTGDNVALPEACTVVAVAPNATGTTIYCGTSDAWNTASVVSALRSAFSVSTDTAVSFNQTSLIDVGAATLVLLDDVMPTPDGTAVFLSSQAGVDLSLWKSAVPTATGSWERVLCRTAAGPSIIRLAPDWDTAPSVLWADTVAALMYVSHDGGAVFANRTPPAVLVDLTVESGGAAGVLYMTSGTNVYKSTNGGYFFGLPVPTNLPVAGTSVSMAPMYPALPVAGNVMVGATGAMAYSLDGAASFMPVTNGLALAGVCVIGADDEYGTAGAAGENMIFIAGMGGLTVYRYIIGTSTTWENMIAGGGATGLRGFGFNNGALYAADATVAAGVRRSINPHDAVGTITWRAMAIGTGAGTMALTKAPNSLRVADSVVWVIDTATVAVPGTLLAWDDWLATASPDVTGPASDFQLTVNPAGGLAFPVQLNWPAMGAGTGLVNIYNVLIWPTAAGSGGGTLLATAALGSFALSPAVTLAPAAVAPNILAYPMAAGTEYTWMARAGGQVSGSPCVSAWSAPRTISVQAGVPVAAPHEGAQLLGPIGGATNVSLNPGFSWTPIAGATEYEFILATDSALTQTVEGTPVYVPDPAWQVPAGTLEYSTVYFWAVSASKPTTSSQSVGSFTTMAEPVEPTPPIVIEPTPPTPQIVPGYIYAIIGVGAVLVIVVLVLIVRTRRPM